MRRQFEQFLGKLLLLSPVLCATLALAGPSGDVEVARIGGEVIARSQLLDAVKGDLDKQQKEHDTQLQQLNLSFVRTQQAFMESELGRLVDNRVLQLEAASRKTTPAILTSALKTPPVTDAEVRSFYDSQKAQFEQSFAQLEPQIRQYLQKRAVEATNRKYFDSLRAKYKASLSMEPLRESVEVSGLQRGPPDAPVTIVEFSDFQCPYCGRFTPVLRQVMSAYPTKVRLVYRYFPLASIHPDARKAAEAAACANNQGKFWEMHDTLFAEQGALGVDSLKEKSKRLGLDTKLFDACLDEGLAGPAVAADLEAGEKLGIGATPATFVNGRFVEGAVTFEQMTTLVEDELRRALP